jgi:mannose-1-phosphate guanylyltransferase
MMGAMSGTGTAATSIDQAWAVVLAGGSGTRLWPLSRAAQPKFLHALTGTPDSLLQATMRRIDPLAPARRTLVVTGIHHAAAVSRQLAQLPPENIVVEPSPRDSCAAVGLAACLIHRTDPGALMGVFPADHLIRDEPAFLEVFRAALAGAAAGRLVTIGIPPTHPETGYGYLRCGPAVSGRPAGERAVLEFAEKPSRKVAERYLATGDYLWNGGMFAWRVDVFLAELRRQRPELHDGLARIARAWDTPEQDAVAGEVWPGLPKISVDYAVMETAAAAGLVSTVPGRFGWHDIGDFHSLGELLGETTEAGNVVLAGSARLRDTKSSVVVSGSGRLVATIGVHDLVIVDTPDVLLVCPRGRAQEIKAFVDELKATGEDRYL